MTRSRRTRLTPPEALERRYRRLLAWYPATYRAANEDEMLGVALSRATPEQRRPDLGEAVNLVASGIRMRFGALRAGRCGAAWRDAAAVFGLIGPVLMAAIYAEALIGQVLSDPFMGVGRPSAAGIVLASGWSLVAVAAILRWRRVAAVGASLGAVGQSVQIAAHYASDPSFVVVSWWVLTLAVMTAAAAVTLLASPASGSRPLSRPAIAAVAAIAAAAAAAPAVESAMTTVTSLPGGGGYVSSPLFGFQGYLRYGLLAVVAIVLLVVVARLDPGTRRRVLVLCVPVAVAGGLTAWGFGGFLASSPRFVHPVLLSAPQWAVLAAAPVLGFAAAMAWLSRHERMLRLVAAGQFDAG